MNNHTKYISETEGSISLSGIPKLDEGARRVNESGELHLKSFFSKSREALPVT
jgi:hypothetical protein